MRIQDLFIESNEHLERVIGQIGDDQWTLMMPEHASWNPQSLTQTVAHHAFDDAWVGDVLAGRTAEQVGDRFRPILDEAAPLESYREYNDRASDSVRSFDDLDAITHLSYGDFPAREYLQHVTSFRAVRTYDIARLIEVDPGFAPRFLEAIEVEYAPLMQQYRDMQIFPEPPPVADDADAQTRVMAMFGRK